MYRKVRSLTPELAAPGWELAEGAAMMAFAPIAPFWTLSRHLADKLLQFADNKIDYVLNTADRTVRQQTGKGSNDLSVKDVTATLESYFNFISKTAEHVVEQLSVKNVQAATAKRVQTARDTLQAALAKAREATDPDVAVAMAWDAWTTFAALPPVAKLLDTAEPATQAGLQAFYHLHDTLIGTPLYKLFFHGTAETINYAATTTPYKLGAQYLYPIVQPVADPAITKVTHSKVIGQVMDYWKPAPAVAAH